MGRLINIKEARDHAPWYFNDAYYSSDGRDGYRFNWPNGSFPHQLCIHNDDIQATRLKTLIRRWIDNSISDTVIVDTIDLDYKKFYGKSYEWEKRYDVSNRWYRFSFEDEHSATMFALAFSEYIKPMTKWHPDKPDDEEYLNRPLEDRYIK